MAQLEKNHIFEKIYHQPTRIKAWRSLCRSPLEVPKPALCNLLEIHLGLRLAFLGFQGLREPR